MSLKQQYPDLNQSVMDDVLKMCRGDKKKAQQIFKDMEVQHQKDLEKARQRKVEDLQRVFSTLTKEVIVQALEENKWDEDKAVIPLFEKLEEQRALDKKQRTEDYKRNFHAHAKQRGSIAIKNIYEKIPEEEISKIFEEYDDFDAAVDYITKRLVEEDKKTQANDMKIETLRTQFSPEISEQEIVSTLQQLNWNLKIATAELLKISEDKRVKSIHLLHPNLTENYIRRVLEANDWQVSKTVKLLSNLHKDEIPEQPQKPVDPNAFPLRSQLLADELEKLMQQRQQAETQEEVKQIKAELEAKLRGADLPGHISDNDTESGSLFPFILKASPARIDLGSQITVEWKTVDHEVTPSDWVGIYYADSTNKRYITYQYIGKTEAKNGALTFAAPKQHGSLNFRYFSNKSYSIKGISNVVKVGPEFSVVPTREEGEETKISVNINQISGNQYPNAWLGVYENAEKPNGKYQASEWLSKAVGNKLTFEVPKTGDWELRLFLDRAFISSYVDYLRTSVNLQGEDTISLSFADNKITVKSKVVTVDPYYDSAWIGLYFVAETNNRQWRRYRYVKSRYAEFVIAAPRTKGTYEARLFTYKAYDRVLCKSNSIVI